MRYPLVLACFVLVLSAVGCTLDDGDKTSDASATAALGKDIVLDIGVAHLEISSLNIGTGTGQIPPGSKVKLEILSQKIDGRKLYSPVVQVSVTEAGVPVTGLTLSPPALFEISYDFNAATADGLAQGDTTLLKVDGTTINEPTIPSTNLPIWGARAPTSPASRSSLCPTAAAVAPRCRASRHLPARRAPC